MCYECQQGPHDDADYYEEQEPEQIERHTLRFSSYAGDSYPVNRDGETERAEVRSLAAKRIRRARNRGCPVDVLVKGERWELGEPEGSAMVPDYCGILSIHVTYHTPRSRY